VWVGVTRKSLRGLRVSTRTDADKRRTGTANKREWTQIKKISTKKINLVINKRKRRKEENRTLAAQI